MACAAVDLERGVLPHGFQALHESSHLLDQWTIHLFHSLDLHRIRVLSVLDIPIKMWVESHLLIHLNDTPLVLFLHSFSVFYLMLDLCLFFLRFILRLIRFG